MSRSPIKIVRIITSLRVSGPALQAILLSAKFNDELHQTQLIIGYTPTDSDNMLDVARAYGIEPIIIPDLKRTLNPISNYRAIRDLYHAIRVARPDVVHTHLTTAGFWGRLIARLAGVHVIVHTLHEHPVKGFYKPFQSNMFLRLERLSSRFTNSLITLSERLRRELADEYQIAPRSAITVLPLGFDLTAFAEQPRKVGTFRQTWQIPAETPLVGIIGRLIPVKNHALFLNAIKAVQQNIPNVHVAIIGDGELRAELEQQVHALGLDVAVTFTGWQKDMPTIYSDLDVLVISSLNEGTPVPIIEALSAGCAVVATEVGGVADLLDNGNLGKLVPSGDTTQLAQAIIDTLQQSPNPDIAKQAMLSRYSIERLVKDLDSLYRGLMK
jgi:glycosyltransferase involved in cell wall biosynthesis